MKITIINQQGEKLKEALLPKGIFGVEPNNDLIHQVVVSQMANRRKSIAHSKNRSEVRGGGKKPWRQKGLGRARHGSIRSPIWIGGGVTFGPRKERVFKKVIPNKMRRLALFMALSAKAKNDLLIILDDLKVKEPKTKLIAGILDRIVPKKESSLIVLPDLNKNVIAAARNIPHVETIQARDLNCLDVVSFKRLIMPKESIKVIEETFFKKKIAK
jgi:large subunit ribosomal protein L4